MDGRARLVLQEVTRSAVAADLDALHKEIAGLRQEVTALERLAGLPTAPLRQRERRVRVLELRSEGHSTRSIAALLGCHRVTVLRDLEALGVPPVEVVGMDGRRTRPQHRNGSTT